MNIDARIVWVYDMELLKYELKRFNGCLAIRLSDRIFVITAPVTSMSQITKNAATFIPPVDLMTKIELRKFAAANANITSRRKEQERLLNK